MALQLIPAIDMLDGKVVRLEKGEYDRVTEYHNDVMAQAQAFEAQGAQRLHVVDLEAARTGIPAHADLIAKVVTHTSLAVQVGGGVRDLSAARRWFSQGAERVVVGTMAVRHPEDTQALCAEFPDKVIVAVDGREGKVAVAGWLEQSDVGVADLSLRAQGWGAAAVLFTDISKDGMSEGPSVEATRALQSELRIDVIASGGIGTLQHVVALRDAGIRQAVCGRALYEGAFSLSEAFSVLA